MGALDRPTPSFQPQAHPISTENQWQTGTRPRPASAGTRATSIEGTWHLTIDTPAGRHHTVLELSWQNGELNGTAWDQRHEEEIMLTGLTLDGYRLSWAQSIRKPVRLNLDIEVTITGDELAGRAKAGRLPASRVNGRRFTDTASQ